MSFISPSMESEMAENAKAAAAKKLAEENAAAAVVTNAAQQGLQSAQQISALAQHPGADAAMGIAGSMAGMATGKAAENVAKAKQALQVAQQLSSFAQMPNGANAAGLATSAAGLATGRAAENVAKVQKTIQAAQLVSSFAGSGTTSAAKATAALAEASLPIKIACEVNINGKIISPVLSANITQKIGDHNKLVLRFHHDLIQEFGVLLLEAETQALLGQVVEIILMNKNNPDGRSLKSTFIITSIDLEEEALAEGIITLTCYSPTWVMEGAPHYQSFFKKKLDEIAKDICSPLSNVKGKLLADSNFKTPITYVCCFNESHWDFLKRVAAETGQWLYYSEDGLVFGNPTKGESFKLVYGQNSYKITMGVKVAPVQSGIFDYDAAGNQPMDEAANTETGGIGSYGVNAFNKSKSLFTAVAQAGPSTMAADKGLLETMSKARSAGQAASLYTIKGSSTVYGLCVGALVDVEFKRMGQSASHSAIRIISIEHNYSATGKYENHFEAILSTASLPPPIVFANPQTHPLLAQVIDNKDPQNQGRVKVKFLGWKQTDAQTTDWIRALTPDAGGGGDKVAKNRGLVTIPEVGDQVMVDFELNNPDRPFITGSVFHGQHGSGGGGGNNVKSLTSKSGHTVRLDDGGGITIKDKSGGNFIVINGKDEITITSSKKININSEEINLTASKDVNIVAGNAINLTAKPATEGGGTGTISLVSKDVMSLQSETQDVQLRAAEELFMYSTKNASLTSNTELNISGGNKATFYSSDTDIL